MSDDLIGPLIGIPIVFLLISSFLVSISIAFHRLSAWGGDWPAFARRFPVSGRVAGGEEWRVPDLAHVKLSPDPWPLDPFLVVVEITVSLQGFGGRPIGLAGKNLDWFLLLLSGRRPPWHPPFWVPWHEVASVTEARFLFSRGVRIAFLDVPHILRVEGTAGHALSANCPSDLLVRK
jgi:hypothetical protein